MHGRHRRPRRRRHDCPRHLRPPRRCPRWRLRQHRRHLPGQVHRLRRAQRLLHRQQGRVGRGAQVPDALRQDQDRGRRGGCRVAQLQERVAWAGPPADLHLAQLQLARPDVRHRARRLHARPVEERRRDVSAHQAHSNLHDQEHLGLHRRPRRRQHRDGGAEARVRPHGQQVRQDHHLGPRRLVDDGRDGQAAALRHDSGERGGHQEVQLAGLVEPPHGHPGALGRAGRDGVQGRRHHVQV
mmetsp:Transcript_38636/g.95088  ORF Transcript_38636/g.95088 Transcript_38636/m.95088 type:complete len:241 (+) Transcript_38636:4085-4807(+)